MQALHTLEYLLYLVADNKYHSRYIFNTNTHCASFLMCKITISLIW